MSSPLPDIPRFNRMVYASGSIAGNVLSRGYRLPDEVTPQSVRAAGLRVDARPSPSSAAPGEA